MTLQLQNLSFSYGKNKQIFNNLNLTVNSGFNLLIGPSGCGKSTLLKTIAGLYPKYGGKVSGSVNLNGASKAMMFQNAGEQFTMATAREEIIFALENLQVSANDYKERLKKAVVFTQISRLLDQKIVTLSGGEKQRVALAVLVAMDVDWLLLDEPFASCDPEARKFLIEKLHELCMQGKNVLISDHLFSDYEGICDTVYKMKAGKVTKLTSPEIRQLFKRDETPEPAFQLPNNTEAVTFMLDNLVIKQNRTLLKQEQLKIFQGKSTLITGVNGIGKSSFFKALTQMIPYEGSLRFHDKEVAKLKSRKYLQQVAQVFQNANDQFLKITVEEEIELSKRKRNTFFTDQKIQAWLETLELSNHLDQVVYTLSGGQKKKLQVLLMLMGQHEVLLFDEPLAGLDHDSAKQVVSLMTESQKQLKQTFLIISHQLGELADLCSYRLNFAEQRLSYVSEVNHES